MTCNVTRENPACDYCQHPLSHHRIENAFGKSKCDEKECSCIAFSGEKVLVPMGSRS